MRQVVAVCGLAYLFICSALLGADAQQRISSVAGAELKVPAPIPRFNNSTVSFKLRLQNSTIVETINDIFDAYREIGPVDECPVEWLKKQCDVSYDITFKRAKPVELLTERGFLTLKLKIDVSGEISVRPTDSGVAGTLKNIVDWHNPFQASFTATFNFKPKLDPDWCIEIPPQPTLAWHQKPEFSTTLGAALNWAEPIDQHIEGKVVEFFSAEKRAELKGAMCAMIREQIVAVWKAYSFGVELEGTRFYVNVDPTSIGYIGPTADQIGIDLGLHLSARTYISRFEPINPSKEFPVLVPLKAPSNEVYLEVPAVLSLRELKSEAERRLVSGDIDLELGVKSANIRFLNIEPIVSGRRIEFHIDFELSYGITVGGKAVIRAEPRVDRQQDLLVLDRVEVEAHLNSSVLDTLTRPVTRPLSDKLRLDIGKAKFDAKGILEFSRKRIEEQISSIDAIAGVKFHLSGLLPTLDRVEIDEGNVWVFAKAAGNLSANLYAVPSILTPWIKQSRATQFKRSYRLVSKDDKSVQAWTDRERKKSGNRLPPNLVGLKIYDCALGRVNKLYKLCEVSVGESKVWIDQRNLAPS